jgi:hypothetical protein
LLEHRSDKKCTLYCEVIMNLIMGCMIPTKAEFTKNETGVKVLHQLDSLLEHEKIEGTVEKWDKLGLWESHMPT